MFLPWCRMAFMRNGFTGYTQTMSTTLEALLFDVDGTLADTEDFHRQAFNAAFADAGLDWSWDQALYAALLAVTGGKERIRYYLDGHLPAVDMTDAEIASLHARKTDFYTDMLADGRVELRPGVERLMQEALEAGLRLGIATTTTPANVEALLQHSFASNTDGWFEVIAAGGIVPDKKPSPGIYHYAMRQMSIMPARCLAFEDSRNGLLSSTAAGLVTLVTVNPYTRDQDLGGAAVVLDSLGEPGRPCRVLSGGPSPGELVDVEYLRELHAQNMAVRRTAS
jgi:HAD superfamily hydrolase (TIGR01509 family)